MVAHHIPFQESTNISHITKKQALEANSSFTLHLERCLEPKPLYAHRGTQFPPLGGAAAAQHRI